MVYNYTIGFKPRLYSNCLMLILTVVASQWCEWFVWWFLALTSVWRGNRARVATIFSSLNFHSAHFALYQPLRSQHSPGLWALLMLYLHCVISPCLLFHTIYPLWVLTAMWYYLTDSPDFLSYLVVINFYKYQLVLKGGFPYSYCMYSSFNDIQALVFSVSKYQLN